MRNPNDRLFYGRELRSLIDGYETEIKSEVSAWDKDKVLSVSEHDLVSHLVKKFTLEPPRILVDQVHICSEGETNIDVSRRFEYDVRDREGPYNVPGAYVTVAIPFEGDPDLLNYRGSTYTWSPPRASISQNNILITISDVQLTKDRIRREIDDAVLQIQNCLRWIKNDCDVWNGRIQNLAEGCVRARKSRLLEQAKLVSSLGLPIRRRADASSTFSIPVTRKKRPVVAPATPAEPFSPEPAIDSAEYDFILCIIDRLAMSIERSPSTFASMKEEQIRDLILVSLNGHYEGDATGETFNAQGKTDILIRADGRNVFIAECKFWNGTKSLHAAIDQVLSYMTWRDTKASVLVFSKNVNFTNVLSEVARAVPTHQNFKKELKRISETHTRYLFRQRDDVNRDLFLAVQTFNIPRS